MTYIPKPINTSEVSLPSDILALVEILAKHNHDVWAQERLDEGWCYGSRRDDEKKQHPCLVPYSLLSETEKDYDRSTAIEVLKAITLLGYSISK
jgi:hypothetical protein